MISRLRPWCKQFFVLDQESVTLELVSGSEPAAEPFWSETGIKPDEKSDVSLLSGGRGIAPETELQVQAQ